MPFKEPIWIIIALPLLVGAYFLIMRGMMARRKLMGSFASSRLIKSLTKSVSLRRQKIKNILLLAGLSLMLLALARPHWGYDWEKVPSRGIDVIFALDVSRSMLAEDIRPSRIDRAKLAILDLLKVLKTDRVGLVAFAGSSFLQCPLTLDYDAFKMTLEAMDVGIIPQRGTDLAAAIAEADAAFDKNANHKLLVLMTDGEDHEDQGLQMAQEMAAEGIKVFTVGVGTAEGELIPVKQGGYSLDYLRDHNGNVIKSKLDSSTLVKIAKATGGFYTPLGVGGEGLLKVYNEGLAHIPKSEREESMKQVGIERYQWPLGIALFLLAWDTVISTRKRGVRGGVSVSLLLALLMLVPVADVYAVSEKDAHSHYEAGDYESAAAIWMNELEDHPGDGRLQHNLASALYRLGRYDESKAVWEQAVRNGTVDIQSDLYYGRGNARFRHGQSMLESDPKSVVSIWESSLADYDSAIELNPDDKDAHHNRSIVEQHLEELKRQLEQQQQQQDQQDQQKQEDQESEDQQSGDQGGSQDQSQGEQEGEQGQQDNPQDGNSQSERNSGQQDGRQNQDQGNQPQNQEQRGQGEQEQDQSAQRPQDEQGQNGQREQGSPGDQGDDGGDASSSRTQQEGDGQQPQPMRPGAMKLDEARRLLESMKGGERKLPLMGFGTQEEEGAYRYDRKEW